MTYLPPSVYSQYVTPNIAHGQSQFYLQELLLAQQQLSMMQNNTINSTVINQTGNNRTRFESTLSNNYSTNQLQANLVGQASQGNFRNAQNQQMQLVQQQQYRQLQNQQNQFPNQAQSRVAGVSATVQPLSTLQSSSTTTNSHDSTPPISQISQPSTTSVKTEFRQRIGSDHSGSGLTSISQQPRNPLYKSGPSIANEQAKPLSCTGAIPENKNTIPEPVGPNLFSDIESNAHTELTEQQSDVINDLVKEHVRKRSGRLSGNRSINKSSSFVRSKKYGGVPYQSKPGRRSAGQFCNRERDRDETTTSKYTRNRKSFKGRSQGINGYYSSRRSISSIASQSPKSANIRGPRFSKKDSSKTALQKRRSIQNDYFGRYRNSNQKNWRDNEGGSDDVNSIISDCKPMIIQHPALSTENCSKLENSPVKFGDPKSFGQVGQISVQQKIPQPKFQSSCHQLNLQGPAQPCNYIRQPSVSADTGTGTISQTISRNSSQENFPLQKHLNHVNYSGGSNYQPAPTVSHNFKNETSVDKNIQNVPDNIKIETREVEIKRENIEQSNEDEQHQPLLNEDQYYNEPSAFVSQTFNNFVNFSQMAYTQPINEEKDKIAKQVQVDQAIVCQQQQQAQNEGEQEQNYYRRYSQKKRQYKTKSSGLSPRPNIKNLRKIESQSLDNDDDDYSTEEEYEISTKIVDGVRKTFKQPTKKCVVETLNKSVHQASMVLSKSRGNIMVCFLGGFLSKF